MPEITQPSSPRSSSTDSLIFILLTCLDTFLNKHRWDGICFHLRCASVINVSSCYWAPVFFHTVVHFPPMSWGVWETCKLHFKNKSCVATVQESPPVYHLFINFALSTREPFSLPARVSQPVSVCLRRFVTAVLRANNSNTPGHLAFFKPGPWHHRLSCFSLSVLLGARGAAVSASASEQLRTQSALHDARLFFTNKLFTSLFLTFTSG